MKWITETLHSILGQSYINWELIIVDDASTDGTANLIEHYALNELRIKPYLLESNKGANFCRNFGIKKVSGDFVVFLDADDLLDEQCLTKRVHFMEGNPMLDLSVHSMQIFENKVGDRSQLWLPRSKEPLHDFLIHKLPWSVMQPIWKTEFIKLLGGFDESFERLQDVEMHTRALLIKDVRYELLIGEPDCYYRIDEKRKNYNSLVFLTKWTKSAQQYCDKFINLVDTKSSRYLLGTICHAYLQILLYYKSGKIKKREFETLEASILKSDLIIKTKGFKRLLLSFFRFYNVFLPRFPGINRMLITLIVL